MKRASKEFREKYFIYFVQGVLSTNVPNWIKIETIQEEINSIEDTKGE